MSAYYNEIDPFAVAWLRELIKAGHIADGIVDDRSIVDVTPYDLRGFTQCHFFAGIGVWSYSIRRAGWSDDLPIWSMSCPCQPFSAAGKGGGFDDERHLWPFAHWLIQQCCPAVVVGEQVASKGADPWIDLVQADLEALGYAFGAVPFPSASVGAPHIRDRTYWLGSLVTSRNGHKQRKLGDETETQRTPLAREQIIVKDERRWGFDARDASELGGMDDDDDQGLEGQRRGYQTEIGQRQGPVRPVAPAGEFGGLADDADERLYRRGPSGKGDGRNSPWLEFERLCNVSGRPGPTNGHWRDADWLFCRDGKWRPVEPESFPLVNGAPARVGRLRGYGNAINAVQAQIFIETIMEEFSS